nr:hypothetical protein [uncultured Aminipila sp.]
MKKFEKQLKAIQSEIISNDGIAFAPKLKINDYDLRFLAAKNLISLKPAGNNEFYITLDAQGFTYFDDKNNALKSVFINWTINFSVALFSAIFGSIVTLFLQYHFTK